MLTAVVGINWGDEGKGRMVDLLSADYDIICRYQGGNNAGHTVVNDRGKFILNLIPSGILREEAVNIMGMGMVIDIEHLYSEINSLTEKNVSVTPKNLKISDKAFICLPYHKLQDILEEDRLAGKKYGSTRRGIAPVYGDKYMKKGIRMNDLFNRESLKQKLLDITEWKNITLKGYGKEQAKIDDVLSWIDKYSASLLPYITDTSEYMREAVKKNNKVLFEAQLGSLRDIDYGIYPFTTSSQTLSSYAPIGAGIPEAKLDKVIGVMKAYSSCVGEGPFAVEMTGESGDALREAGAEYGAATGRPRRVGAFDIVASRYGIQVQGADEIALTKLDVLSYMEKIPVCVAYRTGNKIIEKFPAGDDLINAEPVYEYLDGFKQDISKCRHPNELPKEAFDYIRFIEEATGVGIKYVSVGAGRDDYFINK